MADTTTPFGFPYPEDTDLVRDGASDIENLAEGVNDYLTGGYLYAGTRYYTSSGTFAKADPLGTGDIGLRAIRVRCQAGGGGGGGVQAGRAGGGGSGGNYAESFITDIAGLDASVTVTRGSGGTGGAAGGFNGTAGGESSFGTLVIAKEGRTTFADGLSSLDPQPTGNVGDVIFGGNPGISGGTNTTIPSGVGGGSLMGSGGANARAGFSSPGGNARIGFGGGGAGGNNDGAGGNGANGLVIIDCFV
jgi:hypothetical protein